MMKKYKIHIDYPWTGVPEETINVEIGSYENGNFPSEAEIEKELGEYAIEAIMDRVSWWHEKVSDGETV